MYVLSSPRPTSTTFADSPPAGFHPFLDHLLPNTLLHQSFLPSEPAVLRSLLPRVAWKAVVYYVLLRGAPALAPMAPIGTLPFFSLPLDAVLSRT